MPAERRFKELDGPLDNTVIYPDQFAGIDVRHLSVDVVPLLNAVSTSNLRAHENAIATTPRPGMSPAGVAAANYIDAELAGLGYTVQRPERVGWGPTRAPTSSPQTGTVCPNKLFVVGGHYDSVRPPAPTTT